MAAYHAGDFAEAARELRAYRRMSGDESYRAVLADCERALGRPDNALRLVHEALETNPDTDEAVELRLVEAGAREDLGELPAALLVLEAALGGRPTPGDLGHADLGQLRLATAYADLLEEQGDRELAADWFGAIAAADPDDLTGVSSRFEDDDEDSDGRVEVHESSEATAADADELAYDGEGDEPDVGVEADPDDIEAEVAELLGEAPPSRGALEFDHSRLFQEAPGAAAEPAEPDEQHPPTG